MPRYLTLSVQDNLHCGQRFGWIKMKLGTEVDLGPGHIVLHRDSVPTPKRKGAQWQIFLIA